MDRNKEEQFRKLRKKNREDWKKTMLSLSQKNNPWEDREKSLPVISQNSKTKNSHFFLQENNEEGETFEKSFQGIQPNPPKNNYRRL